MEEYPGPAQKLASLLDVYSETGFVVDTKGRYLETLAGREEHTAEAGPHGQLAGHQFHDVLPEETAERFVGVIHSVLETGEPTSLTYDLEADGDRRWFEATVAPLRPLDHPPDAVIWLPRDVTDRHARERELEARSAAMEASIDGMAILDTNDEYTFVNQAHADVYGYDDPASFLGESWHMCYASAEIERFETEIMPQLQAERQWRGEATGLRKNGDKFPQELSLSLTADDRIICVVRDITDRKERTERLQEQNQRLEEFTRVVSHDLRNPLNVAQGRLELTPTDIDNEHLDAAKAAVDRGLDLVDDLLTLAENGQGAYDITDLQLGEVARDCWQTVDSDDASLSISTQRRVLADRSRLRQLLENIFSNAIDHGGTDISVTIGDLTDGFYIADDGPGIPVDVREDIFDSGYTTAENGTGYGLDIVADIVAGHGWSVSVTESQAGGARFEIHGVERPEN